MMNNGTKRRKTLEQYAKVAYAIEVTPDEESGLYFAEHPDLPGCMAQGGSPDEAVRNLHDARTLWMKVRWEDGLPIPEPPPEDHSGKFLVRIPPALHAELARLVRRSGVSLNHFVTLALAEHVGHTRHEEDLAAVVGRLEIAVQMLSGGSGVAAGAEGRLGDAAPAGGGRSSQALEGG